MATRKPPKLGSLFPGLASLGKLAPLAKKKTSYKQHIRSRAWKQTADQARRLSGMRCENCGRKGWEVHHKTYARLGEERQSDLVVLCPRCHDLAHGRKPTQRVRKVARSPKGRRHAG